MPQEHSDTQLCSRCTKGNKERLHEQRKYIQDMFHNLHNNEILKHISGSPELDTLRLKKVEEIIHEALEGEKEHYIQALIEKNEALAMQLESKEASKENVDNLEKMKQECASILQHNNRQHEREIDVLEQQYKKMLV